MRGFSKHAFAEAPARINGSIRWLPAILHLIASVALLTAAFAPVNQFYLAWIGLVPWLVMVHRCRRARSAFFYSWLGGTLFFSANMWWMVPISLAGMLALMIYCGIYWGLAGLIIHRADVLGWGVKADSAIQSAAFSIGSVLATAAIWTACEYARGKVMTGLPWLFLGHTQSPILAMCQIADLTGAYGVTFWVVAVNALIALMWIRRRNWPRLAPATAVVAAIILATFFYGEFRLREAGPSVYQGPLIAVIQANYPQRNGVKGADQSDILKFHLKETRDALATARGTSDPNVDLVAWSETMMPPINRATLDALGKLSAGDGYAQLPQHAHDAIAALCDENDVGLLTGGEFVGTWDIVRVDGESHFRLGDKRNTAYFFDRKGQMDDSIGHRYDKIHLVPFGEFIPLKYSVPFLYRMMIAMGPKYYDQYELQPGAPDALTVFKLSRRDGDGPPWRFCTPICFEDIDASICREMIHPAAGSDAKRADFLINITNDGWFAANQNAQHLQAATFRSIENRVPTARSVNTGISGFIDSSGQTHNLLPARVAGYSLMRISLDRRLSIYTQYGDWFAWACVGVAILISAGTIIRRFKSRKGKAA